MVPQSLENHPNVPTVLLLRRAPNNQVVHIDGHETAEHGRRRRGTCIQGKGPTLMIETQGRARKDRSHVPLQQGRHAVQPERANLELVLPARHPEAGLPAILLANEELMVGRLEVELGEELGSTALVNELVDVRQRLTGFLGDRIQAPKILAETKGTVLLAREDHRGGMRGTGRLNPAHGQ